jgi:hypothetical protein
MWISQRNARPFGFMPKHVEVHSYLAPEFGLEFESSGVWAIEAPAATVDEGQTREVLEPMFLDQVAEALAI